MKRRDESMAPCGAPMLLTIYSDTSLQQRNQQENGVLHMLSLQKKETFTSDDV